MSVTTFDRRRRRAWNIAGLLTGALLASAAISAIVNVQNGIATEQQNRDLISYNK